MEKVNEEAKQLYQNVKDNYVYYKQNHKELLKDYCFFSHGNDVSIYVFNTSAIIFLDDIFMALLACVKENMSFFVDYLCKKGKELRNLDLNCYEQNPLCFAAYYGHLNSVEMLLKNGADLHIRNELPFRLAVRNGHLDLVKFFVEKGADIKAENNYAIRWSKKNKHSEVHQFLKQL